MNLQFSVYENEEIYNKYNKLDDDKLKKLRVKDIWLKPPHMNFWFLTDIDIEREQRHFDQHAAYSHLNNAKINVQYDNKKLIPILIQKNWLHYDHDSREIQVRNSILPWKEPMWRKHGVKYFGTEEPTKRHKILGDIFFNHYTEEMNFILNLYTSRKIDDDEKLRIKHA